VEVVAVEVRRIDLERARREAKTLLASARARDADALARMHVVGGELLLARAQLALARELGERSWPALVRRAERESASARERAIAFVRAAVSGRLDHADRLLADDASIVRALPAAALVLGEPVEVDPRRPLEPLDWLPLVYVTHSRYLGAGRTDALVRSADRLLAAGGDPDGAFTHPDFGPQSALSGAAGIAHEPRMTELLLRHGANADDGESLYHATEASDLACVRLLLAAGARVKGSNALAHALDREDIELVSLLLAHGPARGEPWPELDEALPWAIFRNRSTRIVRELAAHGADLAARDRRLARTPYALAVARGRPDIAELLAELGAAPSVSETDALVGECVRGDREAALGRIARDPGLARASRDELGRALAIAAGEGRVEATALLLDAGAPLDARGDLGGTPLHQAAWQGRGGTVDLLLRRGADPLAVAPPPTESTPLAWAAHGSRHASAHGDAYLGIGRRLVSEGASRDPSLAEVATGGLADWLAGIDDDEPGPPPAPGAPDLGELAWQLQVEQLRVLASLPGVASRPVGDGLAVRTGIEDNTLNGVVCDVTDEDVEDVVAWLGGLPAQWYVGRGTSMDARLLAAGARPERQAVMMGALVADLDLDGGRRHEIRPVVSEDDLAAWLDVAADWGLVDGPQGARAYGDLFRKVLDSAHAFRMHVAWEGELAIGSIASRRHAEAVSIDHLGVRQGSQRVGVGRALIRRALEAEPAADTVVLAPTPSSIPFYERLGLVLQRFPAERSYYLPASPSSGSA
jgi:ankyrin repeat protein/GNAT superfamily N-acetyltransferase